jgi:hypothetical protein
LIISVTALCHAHRSANATLPNQLVEDPRIGRGTVGGDLGRDRTQAQHPVEEPPCRCQVAPLGQQYIDDLAVLVDRPVQIRPPAGDLDIGLVSEPPVTGSMTARRAASMNSGVNCCTHRYTVTWSTVTPRSAISSSTSR